MTGPAKPGKQPKRSPGTAGKARTTRKTRAPGDTPPAGAAGAAGAADPGASLDASGQRQTSGPDRPVRIPPEHHLNTGLADYEMWVVMFADASPPPSSKGDRRGRVWA
jgi:cyanobactin cluster PatC/TenC/TruC protein